MNIIVWLLVGGALAWIARSTLNFNAARALGVCVIIGAVGALFGGHILSPLLGSATASPDDFNPFALVVAGATSIALLTIADMVYRRFQL